MSKPILAIDLASYGAVEAWPLGNTDILDLLEFFDVRIVTSDSGAVLDQLLQTGFPKAHLEALFARYHGELAKDRVKFVAQLPPKTSVVVGKDGFSFTGHLDAGAHCEIVQYPGSDSNMLVWLGENAKEQPRLRLQWFAGGHFARRREFNPDRKPILCLDFDGVLHSYRSGWKGADVIPDPPVDGAIEFILAVLHHFEVHVFSSRSNQEGGVEAMRNWLIDAGLKAHAEGWQGRGGWQEVVEDLIHFPREKPPAMVTIDDRAITFTGVWPDIDELLAFQPWNKRGAA